MFFTFENFKRAFLGDMKEWWSWHWHRRRLYRRRYRYSRSSVKRKRKDAKCKKLVMLSKDEHDVRRGKLPFVRSFARSFARLFVRLFACRSGVKRLTMEVKKWWREGEGAKIRDGHKKCSFWQIGVWNLSVCKLPNAANHGLNKRRSEVYWLYTSCN
jgi:hypothetical protein